MNPGLLIFLAGMVLAAGLAIALPTVAARGRRRSGGAPPFQAT